MQDQEVGVECHEDPAGGMCVVELLLVGESAASCPLRRLHVDPVTLKCSADRARDVLIHEEADGLSHGTDP